MSAPHCVPTISVCIPCYNSERYIRTTIESVLAQNTPVDELIISDDHSPDSSFAICQEYAGLRRVTVTRPPERTTLGGHYRFLLSKATSDYICFLSSDDALSPNFISTMHAALMQHDDLAIIAGSCVETDKHLVAQRIRGGGLPARTLMPPESFGVFCIWLHLHHKCLVVVARGCSMRSSSS